MRERALRPLAIVVALALAACGGRPSAPRGPARPTPKEPPPAPTHTIIGAVVPQTGEPVLKEYADRVMAGVRLALDERSGPGAPELVVLDDGGDAERDAGLIRDLEHRGAVAVIGPLLSNGLAAAARARADTSLVLVSPTASDLPDGAPNVYSLNAGDTEGASGLARYAAENGLKRVALLHPNTAEFSRQARVFAAALTAAGGTVAADVPYDSGMTTFRTPLRRISASGAQAVYVPAPERDVRQLAPQLSYYGVTGKGIDVLGGEAWTSDDILRLVSARYLNGVVATTPLVKTSSQVAWSDFVARYEAAARHTLDNPFPALGYDAAKLILAGIPPSGRVRPADVSRRIAGLDALRGATGVFDVRGQSLVREPFIVRIEDGKLVPVVTPGATTPGRGARR